MVEETLRGNPGVRLRKVFQPVRNSIEIGGIQFINIRAGKFIMGSKDDNPLAFDQRKTTATLELPEYWMAKFPLTNEQYPAL